MKGIFLPVDAAAEANTYRACVHAYASKDAEKDCRPEK
jgi:hypothetical protein